MRARPASAGLLVLPGSAPFPRRSESGAAREKTARLSAVRLMRRGGWHPTSMAELLWLLVIATVIGWLALIVFGHPVDLTP
jgi:hypothetical protein